MTPSFTESTIEQATLNWLTSLGYSYAFGPDLAFDGTHPERENSVETLGDPKGLKDP